MVRGETNIRWSGSTLCSPCSRDILLRLVLCEGFQNDSDGAYNVELYDGSPGGALLLERLVKCRGSAVNIKINRRGAAVDVPLENALIESLRRHDQCLKEANVRKRTHFLK